MARAVTAGLTDDPLLEPLWQAVHARLCRGDATERSVVKLPGAAPETRRAVDRLLGRVSTAGTLSVRLGTLDEALAQAGTNAAAVAAAVHGPVDDRTARRRRVAAANEATWAQIGAHPVAGEAGISPWLDRIRSQGSLARSGGAPAMTAALDVLGVLPADQPVGRQVLAAGVLGNEHGLDDDTAVGRFVTAGLAARAGLDTPASAAGRAALWASAGVTLDAVSAPALTLALRPHPVGPLTRAAALWADGGVPLPVPATAVRSEAWHVTAGQDVFVCENPSVLEAAAAELGAACRPLVCVSGMPGRAVTELLSQLAGSGARLRYHGDFGAGGLTIANLLVARHQVELWQMRTGDHDMALRRIHADGRTPARLRGQVPEASWDPDLAPAIRTCGVEVTEEHVLDCLLADLGS